MTRLEPWVGEERDAAAWRASHCMHMDVMPMEWIYIKCAPYRGHTVYHTTVHRCAPPPLFCIYSGFAS
jgi:hypothetical protein